MSRLKTLAVAVAAVLAITAGAASAEVWSTSRFTGDHSVLRSVRIDNAPRNLFLSTTWKDGFYEGDVYYWLDVDGRDRGPEYVVHVYLDEFNNNGARIPDVSLGQVETFTTQGSDRHCDGLSGRIGKAGNIFVTLPRACIPERGHLPGSVRMSVGVNFAYGGPDQNGSWAWSPARHQFGPWVANS